MSNYLEVDLNEIASKQIQEKINDFEDQIKGYTEENRKYVKQINDLHQENKMLAKADFFLKAIKAKFDSLKPIEESKDTFKRSIYEVKYDYISKVLITFFDAKENEISLSKSLSSLGVNFYPYKKELLYVLRLLMPQEDRLITLIQNMLLPQDYSKELIKKFASYPGSRTNGCYMGKTHYWSGSVDDAPYDLYFKNPHILDEDIFPLFLESAKSNSQFFWLPEYIDVPDDKINQLAKTLLDVKLNYLVNNDYMRFIKKHIETFEQGIVDYFFSYVQHKNQYSPFYFDMFPLSYQKIYLKTLPLGEVLSLISYKKELTDEFKQEVLTDFFTQKR